MIDCQQVKELLPLWVGQDLPDVSSAATVASHLQTCKSCEQQHQSLQSSLDVLQAASSKTLLREDLRPSMWPELSARITDWNARQSGRRLNDWLPASVMALAVALMVAVTLPSIIEEGFADRSPPPPVSPVPDTEGSLNPSTLADRNQEQRQRNLPVVHVSW